MNNKTLNIQVIRMNTEAMNIQVSYKQQNTECLSDFYDI